MTVEIVGTKSNLTIYRITLSKDVLESGENGVYHATVAYGPFKYILNSSTIKVQGAYVAMFIPVWMISPKRCRGWDIRGLGRDVEMILGMKGPGLPSLQV